MFCSTSGIIWNLNGWYNLCYSNIVDKSGALRTLIIYYQYTRTQGGEGAKDAITMLVIMVITNLFGYLKKLKEKWVSVGVPRGKNDVMFPNKKSKSNKDL